MTALDELKKKPYAERTAIEVCILNAASPEDMLFSDEKELVNDAAEQLSALRAAVAQARELVRHEIQIAQKQIKENSNPVDKHARWFFEAQVDRLNGIAAKLDEVKP
jgi:hypothetical protein